MWQIKNLITMRIFQTPTKEQAALIKRMTKTKATEENN